jgi:hypothetical protein
VLPEHMQHRRGGPPDGDEGGGDGWCAAAHTKDDSWSNLPISVGREC